MASCSDMGTTFNTAGTLRRSRAPRSCPKRKALLEPHTAQRPIERICGFVDRLGREPEFFESAVVAWRSATGCIEEWKQTVRDANDDRLRAHARAQQDREERIEAACAGALVACEGGPLTVGALGIAMLAIEKEHLNATQRAEEDFQVELARANRDFAACLARSRIDAGSPR